MVYRSIIEDWTVPSPLGHGTHGRRATTLGAGDDVDILDLAVSAGFGDPAPHAVKDDYLHPGVAITGGAPGWWVSGGIGRIPSVIVGDDAAIGRRGIPDLEGQVDPEAGSTRGRRAAAAGGQKPRIDPPHGLGRRQTIEVTRQENLCPALHNHPGQAHPSPPG